MKLPFFLLSAFVLAGCMTTQVSDAMKDIPSDGGSRQMLTVEVRNTGWFLFDFIPLVCGDPKSPDAVTTDFFTDTLTLQNNLSVLDGIVERENGYLLGTVTSHEEGEGFLVFIITRQSFHTSATLMRPRTGKTSESVSRERTGLIDSQADVKN